MNELVELRARSPEHCGAIHHLQVRRDAPEAGWILVSGSVHPQHKSRIRLFVGEVAASHLPVVLDTLLGSCVAVCLYDPVLRAGGMNHILLPNCRTGEKNARCGVHAMELLINELMKLGGDRRRFIAKAFGGASVLQGLRMPPVGDKNVEFVREFLATEKMPLVAERLGGNHAVHVYFRTDTSKATVQTVDGSLVPKIIDAEGSYGNVDSLNAPFSGEITFF